MLNRRELLSTASRSAVALALVATGCAQATDVSNAVITAAQQLSADINDIAAGLAGVLPNVAGITSGAASVVAAIQTGVAQLQSLSASVTSVVQKGVAAAAPVVSQFASVAGTVIDDLAGLSGVGVTMPSWLSEVVLAVKTLVPVAMSLAGIPLAAPPSTGMSPAQARLILRAHSGRPS